VPAVLERKVPKQIQAGLIHSHLLAWVVLRAWVVQQVPQQHQPTGGCMCL